MLDSPCASWPNLARLLQSPEPSVLLVRRLPLVRLVELLDVNRSMTWFKAGRIPASVRFDVARELFAVTHGGERHADR